MNAISIKEPWATKIRDENKEIETRTWYTCYRGPILLCASQSPWGLYSGRAFMIADIVDCKPMKKADEKLAMVDYDIELYSWFLKNKRKIEPFKVTGKLRIFEVDTNDKIRYVN